MSYPDPALVGMMVDEDTWEVWDLLIRGDGRIEVTCPHGVGHTSYRLTMAKGQVPENRYYGSHGCDGCCKPGFFQVMEDHGMARLLASDYEPDRVNAQAQLDKEAAR